MKNKWWEQMIGFLDAWISIPQLVWPHLEGHFHRNCIKFGCSMNLKCFVRRMGPRPYDMNGLRHSAYFSHSNDIIMWFQKKILFCSIGALTSDHRLPLIDLTRAKLVNASDCTSQRFGRAGFASSYEQSKTQSLKNYTMRTGEQLPW